MARKSSPQPLTLTDPNTANAEVRDTFNDQRSPLSPKTPKSPRSPFRFTSKRGQADGDQPLMQVSDLQPPRATLPPSTTVSLPSLQQVSGAPEAHDRQERERERPVRSGFFSNYKASKSSSRLQNAEAAKQLAEDSMSRDGRPSEVSSQKASRTGTALIRLGGGTSPGIPANLQLCN